MKYILTGKYNIYRFTQNSDGNYTETILRYNTVRNTWQQVTRINNLSETTVVEKVSTLHNKGYAVA